MAKKAAIKANAIQDAKGHNAEVNTLAGSVVDRERTQTGLSKMTWRGEPPQGLV